MTTTDACTKRKEQRSSSADGSDGAVLSMDMVWTSDYAVTYTVSVQVGSSGQNFSLQVDMGSSDLWIASRSCSSAPCLATNGRLYDPSSSQSTGETFTMQYLAGSVNGPIVWDQVQIGGYSIANQAMAAATTVDNEPLSDSFDGILGLALPLNSLIQQLIPASLGDAPDGAALPSNLFSITDAPSQPFLSLALARPGFSQVPSLLGIGRHPPEIVTDPSQIRYSSLISENVGTLFWKTTVRAITVYINGQAHPIALSSLSGASPPTALLDSGVPLILATPALVNGIYGALGIGPAPDGNYYVPCATPLNMSVTLDGQPPLPLHPLDLTSPPAGRGPGAEYCIGLIQTDPQQLTAMSDVGDMILGVPFLRSVYTVLAYASPGGSANGGSALPGGATTYPALGLYGLTNATRALAEFEQARGGGAQQPGPGGPGGGGGMRDTSLGLPVHVGAAVLAGLAGFFALCLALRCLCVRWRAVTSPVPRDEEDGKDGDEKDTMGRGAYRRAASAADDGDDDVCGDDDPWSPYAGTLCDTIVGTDAGDVAPCCSSSSSRSLLGSFRPGSEPEPDGRTSTLFGRGDLETGDLGDVGARGGTFDHDLDREVGVYVGMAGVGTASARGSRVGLASASASLLRSSSSVYARIDLDDVDRRMV